MACVPGNARNPVSSLPEPKITAKLERNNEINIFFFAYDASCRLFENSAELSCAPSKLQRSTWSLEHKTKTRALHIVVDI